MRKSAAATFVLFWTFFSSYSQNGSITKVPINTRNGNPDGYVEYLPPNYESRNDWPVFVVLHGLGNGGNGSSSSLDQLLNWGVANWLKSNDVPFVLLLPQDGNGYFAGSPSRIGIYYEWARQEYETKTTEYNWSVSYNSASGVGFDEWSQENTAAFQSVAAHIPSAALTRVGTSQQEANLVNSGASVWFHHSTSDNTVSYGQTETFFKGIIEQAGAPDLDKYRYTLYTNVGHSTFNSVVFNDLGQTKNQVTGDIGGGAGDYYHWTSGSFWDWLLAQDKNPVIDETAPVLSAAFDEEQGSIAGSATVNTDEGNGTLFWVVSESPITPAVTEIKAGQDHLGSIAIRSGSQTVITPGVQMLDFDGLEVSTTYYAHFVQTDISGNNSNALSGDGFTTEEADYSSIIAGTTVGSPDFTWTLDESIVELNGHPTLSTGTIGYTASLVPGIPGQSWLSNGPARINPDNSDLINTDNATEVRSISLWFESTNPTGWQNIYEEGGSTHGWHIALYDDYLTFSITQGSAARNSIQYRIHANTSYHVVVVFDLADQSSGSNAKLFVNGSLVGSTNFTTQNFLNSHSGDIQFGEQGDGLTLSADLGSKNKTNFQGKIQRIDYWSEKELTEQDIQDIYILGGEVIVTPPANVMLSNAEIVDGATSGTSIGFFTSDGTEPVFFDFAHGIGSDDNTSFSIHGNELILEEDANLLSKSSYSIRVEAFNLNGTVEESFIISVQEPPLTAPSFLSLNSNTVLDGTAEGFIVGQFDTDGSGLLTYSLVSGEGDTDNGSFSIDGNDLIIEETVDFSSKENYSIRASVSNVEGSFENQFSITVEEPVTPPTGLMLSNTELDDGVNASTIVGTLTASGTNPISFDLVGGVGDTDNASFSILGNELVINLPVDFSVQSSYAIRIRASNEGGFIEESFTITVSELLFPPTEITLDNTVIADASPIGTQVGLLSSQGSEPFTYALIEGSGDTDNIKFSIDENALIIEEEVDFSIQSSYAIRIRVSNEGGFIEESFTITVSELLFPPTEITLDNTVIADASAIGTHVGILSSDGSNPVNYALVVGSGDSDNARFSISEDVLIIEEEVDFSTQSSYAIRIEASNSDGSVSDSFLISVDPLEPTTLSLSTTALVNGTVGGSTVSEITSDGSVPTYALVAGVGDDDNGFFSIENENELVINQVVDFSAKDTYNVRLSAANSVGFTESSFTLVVTEEVLAPNDILLSNNVLLDGTISGSIVGSLSSDGSDPVNYTLVAGTEATDNALFAINSDVLIVEETVDFSVQDSYSILVDATNSEGSVTKSFTITVDPIAPTTLMVSTTEIADGTLAGTLVAFISSEGSESSYTLVSGAGDDDNSSFSITNANLFVETDVDHFVKNSFSIRLRASNDAGEIEQSFVLDVEKEVLPPSEIFLNTNTIENGTLEGTVVAEISSNGTDPTSYFLITTEGSNDNDRFAIDGTNLIVNEDVDISLRSSYMVGIEASNSVGTTNSVFTLTVVETEKLPLTVTANNVSSVYGNDIPPMSISYKGFEDGDDYTVLEQIPTVRTTASKDSPVGLYEIFVEGGSSDKYFFEYVHGMVTIEPSILTVSVEDATMKQGQALPEFIVNYSGFKNNEDSSALIVEPSPSTSASSESDPGTYPITISGGVSSNYSFSYLEGVLTVGAPCDLVIDLTLNGDRTQVTLQVSGGQAPYHIVWSTGQINQNTIDVDPGTYTVSVSDSENCMEEAAITFEDFVDVVLSTQQEDIGVVVWPNPGSDLIKIKSKGIIGTMSLYDLSGRSVFSQSVNSKYTEIDVSVLRSGFYHLIVDNKLTESIRILVTD